MLSLVLVNTVTRGEILSKRWQFVNAMLGFRPALPWSRCSSNGQSHATSPSLHFPVCLNKASFIHLPIFSKCLLRLQLISPDHTKYIIVITVTLKFKPQYKQSNDSNSCSRSVGLNLKNLHIQGEDSFNGNISVFLNCSVWFLMGSSGKLLSKHFDSVHSSSYTC